MSHLRVRNWERFQHYHKRNPPWIRLYNTLLDDYAFSRLQDASKWHAVGLWLLASRFDNAIPDDPTWIGQRINARTPVDIDELVSAGFIERYQDASNMLAPCKQDATLEGEREGDKRESAVTNVTDAGASVEKSTDVENWRWGDLAGWYRTTGYRMLWQADTPPEWAASNGRAWTVERDLSILSALCKKGEAIPIICGVIERNRDPTCMLHYHQAGRWDHWERAKADYYRSQHIGGQKLGAIIQNLTQHAT